MVWAQAFPFVASQILGNDGKESLNISDDDITMFLAITISSWIVLNIVFFCSIDLSYIGTFFGFQTAAHYTCELFKTSKEEKALHRSRAK